MALFCISDPHLSLNCDKPMDVFGGVWENYVEKLEENWKKVITDEDTVVMPGDISWGMNLDQSLADFQFIDSLPGKEKIISKGNHDYWWTSKSKMDEFFKNNNLNTLKILHNNFYPYGDEYGICGSRGWINENGKPHDKKILDREAARLELSINQCVKAGRKPLAFLHYPPVYAGEECEEIFNILLKYDVKQCFYGHIHGSGHMYATDGIYRDIDIRLVSCDYLEFNPIKIF